MGVIFSCLTRVCCLPEPEGETMEAYYATGSNQPASPVSSNQKDVNNQDIFDEGLELEEISDSSVISICVSDSKEDEDLYSTDCEIPSLPPG
ncbi:unnamed protein product [Orchesella dallaii]|uniref:Uncharacterized protein n=1 Tax=Orchesella dallaii TaxID=48710 RepID=A0ABP1S796_9HEXA